MTEPIIKFHQGPVSVVTEKDLEHATNNGWVLLRLIESDVPVEVKRHVDNPQYDRQRAEKEQWYATPKTIEVVETVLGRQPRFLVGMEPNQYVQGLRDRLAAALLELRQYNKRDLELHKELQELRKEVEKLISCKDEAEERARSYGERCDAHVRRIDEMGSELRKLKAAIGTREVERILKGEP